MKRQKIQLDKVEKKFSTLISPAYLALLKKEKNNGPIHRQVVPSVAELKISDCEISDPIGDMRYSPVKGAVHRYPDRILLWPTNQCALHCRFCFRKTLTGADWSLSKKEIKNILDYIKQHKEISEVIFSGGDPFMLSDKELFDWLKKLDTIKHIKRIRFHTRLFSALPSRFSHDFFKKIQLSKPVNIVVHINHTQEITSGFLKVVKMARQAGINLFSQSVLLRGVNDKAAVLRELFTNLLDAVVKPYYLHQTDMVPGTKHFRVPLKQGIKIMKELQNTISGLALPKFMIEIPDGEGKVPIDLGLTKK